jgi:hypothetical protein
MKSFNEDRSLQIRDQSEKPVAFLSDYAHNLDSLNRKNGISETPLN